MDVCNTYVQDDNMMILERLNGTNMILAVPLVIYPYHSTCPLNCMHFAGQIIVKLFKIFMQLTTMNRNQ